MVEGRKGRQGLSGPAAVALKLITADQVLLKLSSADQVLLKLSVTSRSQSTAAQEEGVADAGQQVQRADCSSVDGCSEVEAIRSVSQGSGSFEDVKLTR